MGKFTERDLLAAIERLASARPLTSTGVVLGVGDDAALFRPRAGEEVVLSTDSQVENVHFHREWFTGSALGKRMAAVALSDMAAMAASPRFALLSLFVPAGIELRYLTGVVRGVVEGLASFGARLAGGNVSATQGPLALELTVGGVSARGRAWRRSGRCGDGIVLVGRVGEARAGLELVARGRSRDFPQLRRAYLCPSPLVEVGRLLSRERAIHGAIDVSDGLSSDLANLCTRAGLGCEVYAGEIPLSKELREFCRGSGADPLAWALEGGDDYALLLAVAPRAGARIAARVRSRLGVEAAVVGKLTGSPGRYEVVRPGGKKRRLTPGGWDHLSGR